MNHLNHRLVIAVLTLVSSGISLAAIAPAVSQWNAQSQELQEAANRAQTCNLVSPAIGANTRVVLGDSGAAPASGVYICDWLGMTAEVSPTGGATALRQGQKEQITEILKQRGFKP